MFIKAKSAAAKALVKGLERIELLQGALLRTPEAPGNLDTELYNLKQTLLELDEQLNGNRSKREVGEKRKPSINTRLSAASSGTSYSTYGPTPMHKRSLEIAQSEFITFKSELEKVIYVELPKFEKALRKAGSPWIEGQPIPE